MPTLTYSRANSVKRTFVDNVFNYFSYIEAVIVIGKGHRSTKRKSFTWHMSVITVNPSGATRQHSLVFCKVFYQPVLLLSAIVVSALRITVSGYNSSNIFITFKLYRIHVATNRTRTRNFLAVIGITCSSTLISNYHTITVKNRIKAAWGMFGLCSILLISSDHSYH